MTSIVDKYLIPKELKKTTKYSEEDREHVRYLYKTGMSIHGIARETGMSKRTVQFTLFPERAELSKQNFLKRQKDGRYRYPKEKQSALVREVRKRKKGMLDKLIKKEGASEQV